MWVDCIMAKQAMRSDWQILDSKYQAFPNLLHMQNSHSLIWVPPSNLKTPNLIGIRKTLKSWMAYPTKRLIIWILILLLMISGIKKFWQARLEKLGNSLHGPAKIQHTPIWKHINCWVPRQSLLKACVIQVYLVYLVQKNKRKLKRYGPR